MLLSEAWLDEFQLCIIRKHINNNSWNIYDNSEYTPELGRSIPLFQGSVFSGMHCIANLCSIRSHFNALDFSECHSSV